MKQICIDIDSDSCRDYQSGNASKAITGFEIRDFDYECQSIAGDNTAVLKACFAWDINDKISSPSDCVNFSNETLHTKCLLPGGPPVSTAPPPSLPAHSFE